MPQDLQTWFRQADMASKRELAAKVKAAADKLADAIRQNVPYGKTGALHDSIVVRRTRRQLAFVVTAGGPLTSKEYQRSTRYEREVVIGSGDTANIKRGSQAGVVFDYARAVEFGTEHASAQPFFYTTARRLEAEVRSELEDAVTDMVRGANS